MTKNTYKVACMTIALLCGIIFSSVSFGGLTENPVDPESTITQSSLKDGKGSPSSRFSEPDVAGNLIQTTLGLLVVLAVIAVAAWAFKRFGHLQSSVQGKIKVVGGVSLGARERVVLLQVGEKQLIIGVAPGQIQTLHVLDEPLQTANDISDEPSFAAKLQSVMASRFSNYSDNNK